jgi:hypothetical protein
MSLILILTEYRGLIYEGGTVKWKVSFFVGDANGAVVEVEVDVPQEIFEDFPVVAVVG